MTIILTLRSTSLPVRTTLSSLKAKSDGAIRVGPAGEVVIVVVLVVVVGGLTVCVVLEPIKTRI